MFIWLDRFVIHNFSFKASALSCCFFFCDIALNPWRQNFFLTSQGGQRSSSVTKHHAWSWSGFCVLLKALQQDRCWLSEGFEPEPHTWRTFSVITNSTDWCLQPSRLKSAPNKNIFKTSDIFLCLDDINVSEILQMPKLTKFLDQSLCVKLRRFILIFFLT